MERVQDLAEVECGDYVEGAAKCFTFTFTQPLDHSAAADGETFQQRARLIHRGCSAPVTVMDSGYGMNRVFYEYEPNIMFGSNTLDLEHRFQGKSLPPAAKRRWTSLSIENGAGDMHDIITAFRKVYAQNWVSTGASKGGITAVYHRYLFPSDLDGTIAYVAPSSLARQDKRYQERFDTKAFPSACRDNVRAFQVAGLSTQRPAFVAHLLSNYVATETEANEALEGFLSAFDWAFWQYESDCNAVPVPSASAATLIAYFDAQLQATAGMGAQVSPPPAPTEAELTDAALAYEWSWQQGFALQVGAHILPLVDPATVTARQNDEFWKITMPKEPLPAYDGTTNDKARQWARASAERMLLIYGESDPWSGGALDAPTHPSSGRYFAPGRGHGAQMAYLAAADKKDALGKAATMYGRAQSLKAGDAAVARAVRSHAFAIRSGRDLGVLRTLKRRAQ
jgi:hypothetical protein